MKLDVIGKWAFVIGLVIAVLAGLFYQPDSGCDSRPSQCHRRRYASLFVGCDCVNSFRNGAKYYTLRGDEFYSDHVVCGSLCRWCDARGCI